MSAPRELEIVEADSPVSEPRRKKLSIGRVTLFRLLRESGWTAPIESTKILLDGEDVPFHLWNTVIPKSGSTLVFVRRSHAEGLAAVAAFFAAVGKGAAAAFTLGAVGGGSATGAAIAAGGGVFVETAAFIGFTAGSLLGTVALSAGISAVTSSLIGRPNQDIDPLDGGGSESPTLQGTGNSVRPNAPFPYVAGAFRLQPPFGSFPYTVVRGTESVFMALFIAGLGRVQISNALIGDIPIAQFTRARSAIRAGSTPPTSALTIYTNKVFQTGLNSTFDPIPFGSPAYQSPWVQFQVPGEGHGRLGVDFNFPGGLAVIRDKGARNYFFAVEIQYRVVGSGTWLNAVAVSGFGPFQAGGATTTTTGNGLAVRFVGQSSRPFQVGFTWTVSGGATDKWEVQIRRVEEIDPQVLPGGPETNTTFGTFIWFAIKGFNFRNPPLLTNGVATYELEVPLDTQFNGLQSNFSILVSRYYRIPDPTNSLGFGIDSDGWSLGYVLSSNPAAIIRDMLQGESNRRPVPNSKINISALGAFYGYCLTYNEGGLTGGLQFNFVFDSRMDLFEACNVVANAGRGKFGIDSQGRFTVIWDGPVTTPVAKVTAANSRNFSMQLLMPKELHAIRCQFIDQDAGFDPDAELVVYADGFNSGNADENFIQNLSLPGVTRRSQIYLLGRYFIAERQLRRRMIMTEQGLEHLQYGVGQLVTFSHPAALIGVACEGRVKSSSSAVYRDLFDQDPPPYSDSPRGITGGTAKYADLSGPVSRGEGAGLLTASGTGQATIITLFSLSGTLNFSGTRFDLSAMVGNASNLSSTDGIRLRFYGPTLSDWKEWRFGTSDGLNAVSLQQIGQAFTDTPDASSGSFNQATMKSMEIFANVVGGAAGRTYRFCDFRISRVDAKIAEVELDQLAPFANTTTTYEIEYRRELGSIVNEINRYFLARLTDYAITSARKVKFVYLQTPITAGTNEPLEGMLFSFGESNKASARMICREKIPGPDLTSKVVFVDEAPAVHNVTSTIPSFGPQSTLPAPLQIVGPPTPEVFQVVSDERALLVLADGTLKPRILIHLAAPFLTQFGRPLADFYAVYYRRVLPSSLNGLPLARVTSSATEIIIEDVEEDATYEISIQGVTSSGRTSSPNIFLHRVVGKTGLPPNVEQFRLEGIFLRWTLPNAPPDLAGFKIKKGPVGGTYEQARWITEPMLVAAPPFDVSTIADPGNATVYIVAVDTVGNESPDPDTLTGFIGVPVAKNVIRTVDIDAAGFGIIDQEERFLSGFESLIKPSTPTSVLTIGQIPGEDPDPVASLTSDVTNGILDVERSASLIDEGMQALKVTRNTAAAGPIFFASYSAPMNFTKRKLQGRFRGGKASVTWTVAYKLVDFNNSSKWSRWDVTGLGTLSYVNANVDLSTAPTATNGGGADLTTIGVLEVATTCSSPASGDFVHFDNIRWVGGTVNGVEVISGDLKNMVVASNFWPLDLGANFWNSNLSADFWGTQTYLDGIYEFQVEILSADLPGNVRISISPDPGVDFQIFYKVPSGTEFMPFPGVLKLPETGFYRFKILLAGGFVQGVIDQLAVIVDVEDVVEKILNFSVSSTGTVRLPITKTFRTITDIMYTVRGTTPGIALFLDYQTTIGNGPSVQIVNSTSGARITASADFEVRGT